MEGESRMEEELKNRERESSCHNVSFTWTVGISNLLFSLLFSRFRNDILSYQPEQV